MEENKMKTTDKYLEEQADDFLETITFYIQDVRILKSQLEEIYEALVGDNGMERFTHAEIIDWAHQLVDKEEEI